MKKFLFLTLLLLSACSVSPILPDVSTNPTSETWRCGIIQERIEALELSGKWQAEFNASAIDTLIINSDGTYKQVFVNSASNYQYESQINSWWLEDLPGGGIYLHLSEMLYCEGFDRCVNPSNVNLGFYDYCGNKWFNLNHKIILAVVGDSTSPKGLRLRFMRPAGCEGCFENYYFVEK
jgi:hypothetical protein